MRLWVDDLRQAPEGYQWVKTINEAIRLLATESIEEVSMDYDISLAVGQGQDTPHELDSFDTFEAVAWFIASAYPSGSFPITIHSRNEDAPGILGPILEGWNPTVTPLEQENQHLISADQPA